MVRRTTLEIGAARARRAGGEDRAGCARRRRGGRSRLVPMLALLAATTASCSSVRDNGALIAGVAVSTTAAHDAATASESAVDIRAIGCKAEAVRGAGAMVAGGYVLTAAHVVAGSLSVSVTPTNGATDEPVMAAVVALDPENDLALLAVPGLELPELPLGSFATGDAGVALIFRDGAVVEQPFSITRPVLVHILDIYDRNEVDRQGYQLKIDVSPGDSGAILVGTDGVAGAALYAKSRGAHDRAWAVGLDTVPTMVAAAKDAPIPAAPVGECAH